MMVAQTQRWGKGGEKFLEIEVVGQGLWASISGSCTHGDKPSADGGCHGLFPVCSIWEPRTRLK